MSGEAAGCNCVVPFHATRRVVLTGGPGAGKTAVLEIVRRQLCAHVAILPEAASLVFGGGFPRGPSEACRQAAQRAIFHVQTELENAFAGDGDFGIALCDRGTIDGLAYWPGRADDLLSAVHTTRAAQLARYDAVIHLQTPESGAGYHRGNPLRIETAAEAARLDEAILHVWDGHPRRFVVASRSSFLAKAAEAIELLREELPPCCRGHRMEAGLREGEPPSPVARASDATRT